MNKLNHLKRFNESDENLNIPAVINQVCVAHPDNECMFKVAKCTCIDDCEMKQTCL